MRIEGEGGGGVGGGVRNISFSRNFACVLNESSLVQGLRHWGLQWLTGYLGLTLVSGWSGAQRGEFGFRFSRVSC